MQSLAGRTIALCVTGSIAAYKAVLVARLCIKAGASVVPVMTASASKFVGAATFSGICGAPVVSDMWGATGGEIHVELGERADVVAIVPATADVLSRLAAGRADDVVTALALSARGPVLVAPAMHPRMWSHPATRRNVDDLERTRRVTFVGPEHGEVASGDVGVGRMSEPSEIVAAIARAVTPQDLAGKRVLVTAGPTFEDLDPVRYLANRSTGKMGFAIAERAATRGANVMLVTGPVSLATPAGVERVDVRTAVEMRNAMRVALGENLEAVDAVIMSAAVADFRPRSPSARKIKKGRAPAAIPLAENPDLLGELGRERAGARPLLVGFALETGNDEALVAYARGKLQSKSIDMVVANLAGDSLGTDDNRAIFVTAERAEAMPRMSKHALADALLDRMRDATALPRAARRPARAATRRRAPKKRR
jgi:phosphopantothenoylcysteine decarboxylase/phosphopantothenate--cysteine ligase